VTEQPRKQAASILPPATEAENRTNKIADLKSKPKYQKWFRDLLTLIFEGSSGRFVCSDKSKKNLDI
jgi:hypothetical protein